MALWFMSKPFMVHKSAPLPWEYGDGLLEICEKRSHEEGLIFKSLAVDRDEA